jgi:hypothetical protein
MSRREIVALNPNHLCVVGYDRGMSTFFCQVTDREIERRAEAAAERVAEAYEAGREPDAGDLDDSDLEALILWLGADQIGQVETVEELAGRLRDYALIGPEMLETLREDRQREEAPPRTAMERFAQSYVNENSHARATASDQTHE